MNVSHTINVLYKIQKNQTTNSDIRDMMALESALYHIPSALTSVLPHIAVSFSAVSIRDINTLLSSPQLNICKDDRRKLLILVQILSKIISNKILEVVPRKNKDIFE
jgi:hypothetical protein